MSKSAEGGGFKAQRRFSAQVRHSCLRQKALFTHGGPKKKSTGELGGSHTVERKFKTCWGAHSH